MSPSGGFRHSRWRTWLRGHTPDVLYDRDVVIGKAQDCGDHEWYNHDGATEHCYHCRAERKRVARTLAEHKAPAPVIDPGPDVVGWHETASGQPSEAGVLVRHEEFWEDGSGAGITLEAGGSAPFAITCGLYGWMVHTRFFGSLGDAENAVAAMKPALEDLVRAANRGDLLEDRDGMFRGFVEAFP